MSDFYKFEKHRVSHRVNRHSEYILSNDDSMEIESSYHLDDGNGSIIVRGFCDDYKELSFVLDKIENKIYERIMAFNLARISSNIEDNDNV